MANAECVYVVPRSLVNALDASSDSAVLRLCVSIIFHYCPLPKENV